MPHKAVHYMNTYLHRLIIANVHVVSSPISFIYFNLISYTILAEYIKNGVAVPKKIVTTQNQILKQIFPIGNTKRISLE